MDAINQADLKDLIKLKGLDYIVGEQGSKLSVGQLQKIEIARALLHQRPIILADEITSALDLTTAQKIRDVLFKLPYTVIEVAHKVSEEERKKYTQILDVSAFK